MKRENIVVVSIMVVFLMIVSAFVAGSGNLLSKEGVSSKNSNLIQDTIGSSEWCDEYVNVISFTESLNSVYCVADTTTGYVQCDLPDIEVDKKVWNSSSGWAEYAEVYEGDTVRFNVSIYNPHCEYEIHFSGIVKDELPCNLRYINGSSTIYGDWPNLEEVFWGNNTVLWRKPPDIPPLQYLNFTYRAIAVCDCGSEYESNYLLVSPDELVNVYDPSDIIINDGSLNVSDNANVKVICVEEPEVTIEKYVKWDCTPPFKKNVTASIGDWVTFKLYVNNTGDIPLDIYVRDELPSGLTYVTGSTDITGISVSQEEPEISVNTLYWNFTNVPDGASIVITFRADVDECGEHINVANVTGEYDCQEKIYDEDTAIVYVPCPPDEPDVEIVKKVKNSDGDWVNITTVYTGDDVEFKLTVTNTGEINLSGVLVTDDLPSFLTFNNDANITPSTFSNHHIEWNLGTLTVESSKEITFSAHAITVGEGDNIAGVTTCQGVNDEDDAHVIVAGMIIEKEVWDPNLHAWMEEIDASVGDTVKFRITIYHYGNGTYTLYNIRVRDELPECLEYANNANPTETDISTDGKTIWWNLSVVVNAGESTAITFYALITETSGCGPCINLANATASECSGKTFYWEDTATVNSECPVIADAGGPYSGEIDESINLVGSVTGGISPYTYAWDLDDDGYYDDATGQSITKSWSEEGTYYISLKVTDNDGRWDTDDTAVTIAPPDNSPPNKPSKPSGTTSGDTGTSYTYSTSATDPDDDIVKYGWDWDGNGAVDEWTGFYSSGTTVSTSHSWIAAGTYNVKVKAEDEYGSQNGFSTALTVVISGNDPPNKPTITGPISGKAGKSYTYSAYTIDPDGDQVYYWFDWDDGTTSGWKGPYNSGQTVSASHILAAKGTYQIRVKSKDINDAESVWSNPLPISMPKNKSINPLFLRFLEEHPHTFPILKRILGMLSIH